MFDKDLDLFDEYNCSDGCEVVSRFCHLVDRMVKTIQELELECIRTRHELSKRLEQPVGEYLKEDILSNLGDRFFDDPAYRLYMSLLYDGGDPMNFKAFLDLVEETRRGEHDIY